MKTLNSIQKDLIKKAQKKWWIWENFWQKELMNFIDSYEKLHWISLRYWNPNMLDKKHQKTIQKIKEFDQWCSTFTLAKWRR